MFGEFNEATQIKTSLAKYSIEFNDLAVQMRPHRIAYLRLLGRPYTLLYVRRSVGRLELYYLAVLASPQDMAVAWAHFHAKIDW